MTILETERLLLREFQSSDAENMYLLNLNPEVIKYTGDEAFSSIESALNFIENYDHYQKFGFGRWAVIVKETNKFIGWCGLKFSPDKNETDIGFRFFQECWNKGFATESATACLNFGFQTLKINRIIGRAMKENTGSIKVLEKIGMKYLTDFDFDSQEGVIYELKQ